MSNHSHSQIDSIIIENLYKTLRKVEMGVYENPKSSDFDPNAPWMRTKFQPKGGSTAYGPLQLTGAKNSMLQNIVSGYNKAGATQEEIDWIDSVMLPQAESFRLFGGKDMIPGMERYDYGGMGDFDLTNPTDTTMYNSIAKKLIKDQYNVASKYPGDRLENFLNLWRFGQGKANEALWGSDSSYIDKGKKYYKSLTNP